MDLQCPPEESLALSVHDVIDERAVVLNLRG